MKVNNSVIVRLLGLLYVIIFICAGCQARHKPDLSKHLVTLNFENFFGTKIEPIIYMSTRDLPSFLQQDPLIGKITKAVNESIDSKKITRVYITKDDLLRTNEMISDNFGARATNMAIISSENKLFKVISKYLMHYYTQEDGFIDREGTIYTPPKIKDGIGSDIIGPTFAILLEALYDCMFRMPVFYDEGQGNWMTRTGKEPTVHKEKELTGVPKEKIVTSGERGITKIEFEAMRYISGLAGDQSMVLSGAAYRLLGDLQLGVVFIASHFSIGDNETLARILDEFFKVTAKRLVEYSSYLGFKEFPGLKAARADTPAARLLQDLGKINSGKK